MAKTFKSVIKCTIQSRNVYLLHNMAVSGGHSVYFFCIPAVNYNLADLAGCFIRSEWCQFAAGVRKGGHFQK